MPGSGRGHRPGGRVPAGKWRGSRRARWKVKDRVAAIGQRGEEGCADSPRGALVSLFFTLRSFFVDGGIFAERILIDRSRVEKFIFGKIDYNVISMIYGFIRGKKLGTRTVVLEAVVERE